MYKERSVGPKLSNFLKNFIVLYFLGCRGAFADNPFQNLANSLSGAVNKTSQVLGDTAQSVGSDINNVANQTATALSNNTVAVGEAVLGTTDAAQGAADGLAAESGKLLENIINATAITSAVGGPVASLVEGIVQNGQEVRHPVVFWPGFGTSRLRVEVENQDLEPDCPGSGTFHTAFGIPTQLEGWPEGCIYKLLQLKYDAGEVDFNNRFSSQPSVNTSIASFGSGLCAPIPYEPMYLFLEAVGYEEGKDFFVACYDWRMSPFQDVGTDGAHLERAKMLVEEAYNNAQRPVYLMGHSNGPLYALALLNNTSKAWKSKYIAGLVGLAGNWAGQGGTYAPIFSGQSLFASSWYSKAAAAFESWPSSYMSLATPAIFNDSEVVIQATVDGHAKNYTPEDYGSLFKDANLTLAQELAPRLIGNISAKSTTPGTHFFGFYGSGQDTLVGVTLANLSQGPAPNGDGNIYRDGDGNQEAADNLSVLEWKQTQDSCFRFELNEYKGVSHLGLPFDPTVLYKTVGILFSTPRNCSDIPLAAG